MKNKFFKTIFAFSVVIAMWSCVANAQKNDTFKFEPSKSTISGTIVVETFFDANENEENSFILKLDYPIKVVATHDDELNTTTDNVTKVQLTASDVNLSIYKNKKVHCTGVLFSAITAHHHTEVLMSIETIKIQNDK